MTSLRNRIVFSCLSIIGTAGLVSFSNPASAESIDDVRQTQVFTGDLDLRHPAGQATFARRIAAAANQVCAEHTREVTAAEASCRRTALAQARRDAGLADVAIN